jgi:hypothetical protein
VKQTDTSAFIQQLKSEGVFLNDRQEYIVRRRMLPLDTETVSGILNRMYEVDDRVSPAKFIQALKASTVSAGGSVHSEHCQCDGHGWVDAAPVERHDRSYSMVERCQG